MSLRNIFIKKSVEFIAIGTRQNFISNTLVEIILGLRLYVIVAIASKN